MRERPAMLLASGVVALFRFLRDVLATLEACMLKPPTNGHILQFRPLSVPLPCPVHCNELHRVAPRPASLLTPCLRTTLVTQNSERERE